MMADSGIRTVATHHLHEQAFSYFFIPFHYVLSFACAKERTKEKHTGNDIQPLPGALIKLLYYC
jgi:hypothetical protein